MSTTTFNDALCFVAQKHSDQGAPGSLQRDSYSNHCLRVADYVRALGGNDTLAVVALLYATLQESVTTMEELVRCFGASVAQKVWQLTEDKGCDSRQYWTHQINRLSADLLLIKLISVLDILCAMTAIDACSIGKKQKTTLGIMTYAELVHHVFFVALSETQRTKLDERHMPLLQQLQTQLTPYIRAQEKSQEEAIEETAQYLLKLEQAAVLY